MTHKHSQECNQRFDQYKIMAQKYAEQWPDHCIGCEGWSGSMEQYDPSPDGVSLSSGYMTDWNTCPDCVEENICPRCGQEVPFDEENVEFECQHCGFVLEVTDGLPQPPECFCWYAEEQELYEKEYRDLL